MEIKARSEKRSSVITDLVYVLILLIKEKDSSASALDISNVQPATSRKRIIHVTCTQSFKNSFRNLIHFFVRNSHLPLCSSIDLGYWRRSFSHLSISLMYSSEESRSKDGTRERGPRAWRSFPLNSVREYCHSSQYQEAVVTETTKCNYTPRNCISGLWSRQIK